MLTIQRVKGHDTQASYWLSNSAISDNRLWLEKVL